MCGISGMVGPGADRTVGAAMIRSLRHRGPDDSGEHYEPGRVFLGHNRLSILDIAHGHQPMASEDRSLYTVHNGEVYNSPALRRELEEKGYRFRTTCDAEVVLVGWQAWGPDLLARLDGMFAFAIWDARSGEFYLARDLFGIKPLHYAVLPGADGPTLVFGSEAKAILQHPAVPRRADLQALHWFLNLRYVPGEQTLFEGIRRLLPGHFLRFRGGGHEVRRYAALEPIDEPRRPEEHYAEGIRHYLREAVRKQLLSDVPVGAYLSGGLDSSSLVAYMSELTKDPIPTFCLGFNEPTDELDDARFVADRFGCNHHGVRLDPNPLREFPAVIWSAEEPKENIIQGFLLARFARSHVKVVLGGLGGDELFAGYMNNRFVHPTERLQRLVPGRLSSGVMAPLSRTMFRLQQAIAPALRLDEMRRGLQLLTAIGDPLRFYLILRNVWDEDPGAARLLYGPALSGREPIPTRRAFEGYFADARRGVLERVLWAELHTKMIDDFLLNEDRTSMASGLEVRVPFLDRDLVRFALSIPVGLKIRGNETKYIFRKAMRNVLPERTLSKPKWGFGFNPYHQFTKDLKIVAEKILTPQRVSDRGWFNYGYLRRILDHPPHPRLRWHYFELWLALGLEIWCRMFLEGDVAEPRLHLEDYS